jgi:aminoglycoside phosphotransferase (APT) family kinase protein
MSARRMHAAEIHIDEPLVRRLLTSQFPQWADLPLKHVRSAGTENALYRLGTDRVVRLPRIKSAVKSVEKEQEWLPRLVPHLPIPIPVPLAMGSPGEGYPFQWSIYTWLEGESPTLSSITDVDALTGDVVRFVDALHRIDLPDGPPSHRGAGLKVQDTEARAALAELEGIIDCDAAASAWDEALTVMAWSGEPVWIHGDLLPGNLLLREGRLTGIIDLGALGVGDPACDMIVAWGLLPPAARDDFRAAIHVDDATWARGRGWALSIGLIALPYYKHSNPEFAAVAHHLIDEVLAEYKRWT